MPTYRSVSQQLVRKSVDNLSEAVRNVITDTAQNGLEMRMFVIKSFIMRWFVINAYFIPDFDTPGAILDYTLYLIPNIVNLLGKFSESQEIWMCNSLLELNYQLHDMKMRGLVSYAFHTHLCRYLSCWHENLELILMSKRYSADIVMPIRIALRKSQTGDSVTLPYAVKLMSPLKDAPVKIVNAKTSATVSYLPQ